MTTPAIQADGLVKRFGTTTALAGVDLEVPQGTVLGLLGPNGAGKTTAVRILATLLRADAGRAAVAGYDVVAQAHQVRQLIGMAGQYASVDENLSGRENLYLVARLLGLSRSEARARGAELIERFGLSDAAGRRVKTYSGGMRRRIDLAVSMVGRPEVLYLDEPTTGLDAHSRGELWALVRDLVSDGTTVLLTTHHLDEADQMSDGILVIDQGRVIASGAPSQLKARTGSQVLEVRPADAARLVTVAGVLEDLAGSVPTVDHDGHLVSVQVHDPALVSEAVRRLDHAGIILDELALRRPSLDEVFLTLTGGRPAAQPTVTEERIAV